MEERECVRCGAVYIHEDKSVTLCEKCDDLVHEAMNLIESDPKVNKYYNELTMEQSKAELRIEKLKYLYQNNKSEISVKKALKKTGKAVKKAYNWNLLEYGLNTTKKLLNKEQESEEQEIDKMMEEIIYLEEFVSTNPIEFVIFNYLTPEEEKEPKVEEKKEDPNVFKKNFFTNSIFSLAVKKFDKMDKDKQVKVGISTIIVFALLLIGVCFLI